MNPFVNNGTLFYISATLPATYDLAGYEALTWTRIQAVRAIGDLGEAYETFDNNVIGGIRSNVRSGKLPTTIELELIKIDDAGQDLLKAAFESKMSYSYRVLAVDGVNYYFTAECATRFNNSGQSGTIADIKTTLQVDSRLLEI
jgi:hypothetical protein